MAVQEIVTKAEYAAMHRRTPGAVSHWVKEGKLFGAALVGEGRNARIRVAEANRQLGLTLHPGQQMAQRRPVGTSAGEDDELPFEAPSRPRGLPTPEDDQAARYQRARAEKAELEAAELRHKAQERAGHWIVAEDARREFAQQLGQMVRQIESWLPEVGLILAGEHGGDHKQYTTTLRASFRNLREKIAQDARREAQAAPAYEEEDPIADEQEADGDED